MMTRVFSFGQGAVIGHFVVLAVLWVTRDMGGEYGWGSLFTKGFVIHIMD